VPWTKTERELAGRHAPVMGVGDAVGVAEGEAEAVAVVVAVAVGVRVGLIPPVPPPPPPPPPLSPPHAAAITARTVRHPVIAICEEERGLMCFLQNEFRLLNIE